MRINWLMVLPLLVTGALLGILGVQLANNQNALNNDIDTQALPSSQQGRVAPDIDLGPLGDTSLLTRADLEGNGLVIVNFWASWCPPCRAEHPLLTELAEAGNPLFGVNYRDRTVQALGFLDELGNPFERIGTDDEDRNNGINWGIVAMPETFFIDDNGTVVLHFRGPVTRRALEDRIIPALAEQGHALVGFEDTTPTTN